MNLRQTLQQAAVDLRERALLAGRPYGLLTYVKLPLNPPALAVLLYRFQHWLHTSGWPGLAEALRYLNLVLFTTDIGSAARIDAPFILYHANGINIGGRARLGRNVHLVHHCTIATGPRVDERPDDCVVLEDDVIVGCGARIVGNLTVGAGAFIGAGAVALRDISPYSFYVAGPGESADEMEAAR
jgi:serine O-acetyltransferase